MALTIPENMVRFITCDKNSFANATKNANVFYKVTDGTSSDLYLGSELLSNQAELEAAIGRVATNESAISALQAKVNAWVQYDDTAVKGLISAEESARKAADEALGTRITNLDNDTYSKSEVDNTVSGLQSSIGNKVETSTYNAKVSELEGNITSAANAASAADAKAAGAASAAAEAKSAASAAQDTADAAKSAIDAFLDENAVSDGVVDTLKEIQAMLDAKGDAATLAGQIQEVKDSVATEKSAREAADATLDGKISKNATDIGTNTAAIAANATAIATEKSARENAISTLTSTVDGKADQSALNTLSGTVNGHTSDISGLQTSVGALEGDLAEEVTRATGRENAIEQNINDYKGTVASTYETIANVAAVKSNLEGQISQAENRVKGTDNRTTWEGSSYATTIGGAKDFAYDVAFKASVGAANVAKAHADSELQAFVNNYLTWNSLASLNS